MSDLRFGRNGDLIIEDRVDHDGELEINIPSSYHTNITHAWISKSDAIKIIEHLSNVFSLTTHTNKGEV